MDPGRRAEPASTADGLVLAQSPFSSSALCLSDGPCKGACKGHAVHLVGLLEPEQSEATQ